MINIFFVGATDRFNYGDLLFPVILNQYIKKYNKGEGMVVKNYGIIESDLSKFGALPTFSIRKFYKDCETSKKPIYVIVVGGEVLGTQWGRIFSYLNKYFRYFYKLSRFFLGEYANIILDTIAKLCLGGKNKYPFLIELNDYLKVNSVFYNSVGGMRRKISIQEFQYLKRVMKNSVYCSFRDQETFNRMKLINENAKLAPDSAILMSKFYSKFFLYEKYSSKEVLKNQYIFFQISNHDTKRIGAKKIAKKLSKTIENCNKSIIFCPIGTAIGHEDHIALHEINQWLNLSKEKVSIINEPNIYEIMCLIANSTLYIGSSLHGIITAMSYSVPYISLKNTSKITSYLDTWAIKSLNSTTNLTNWDSQIEKAFRVDRTDLELNRKRQIELANNSMDEIFSKIFFSSDEYN